MIHITRRASVPGHVIAIEAAPGQAPAADGVLLPVCLIARPAACWPLGERPARQAAPSGDNARMSLSNLFAEPREPRRKLSTDGLIWLFSLLFTLACNGRFWHEVMAGRDLAAPGTWGFAAAIGVFLLALHALILGLLLHGRLAKPVLSLLLVATAFAVYYTERFNVFLDPTMLRNVLRTDVKEARELFNWSLVPYLLGYAVLPLALLWWLPLKTRRWGPALLRRAGLMLLALALLVLSLLTVFQDFGTLMRNRQEVRYLITPANYLYSLVKVGVSDTRTAARPRQAIGTDAQLGPEWAARRKPVLLMFVLGETVRAANWGLSGYARQTTPELAALGNEVINFREASSCGTNTETSVPCLFSPWGRRQYDEDRIRGSQSLLHVLDRSGIGVVWRDNQSGCKGVCDGLPSEQLRADAAHPLCDGERCLDELLLKDMDRALQAPAAATEASGAGAPRTVPDAARQSRFVVLHMLGNHGPAYHRRYPAEFRRFTPTCDTADLRLCERAQIVNSYDNAVLYTDHVLAQAIAYLKQQSAQYDTGLIYVSDHGESLGERNLFLHGVPWSIAPDEQTRVPLLLWFSPGLVQDERLDLACLRQRAAQPASHDHLFHSVLGLLSVRTTVRDATMDLFQTCRRAP
jgi:lipid A ethanolaminephosphotransferase